MSQAPVHTPARVTALLAAMAVAAVAGLPVLLGSPLDTAGLVSASVLTLALSAVALLAVCVVVLAARTPATVGPVTREAPPVLARRITDRVHHPVRPRAPGTV